MVYMEGFSDGCVHCFCFLAAIPAGSGQGIRQELLWASEHCLSLYVTAKVTRQ
jgi:hypothetical protein